jgi:hypothetical protein
VQQHVPSTISAHHECRGFASAATQAGCAQRGAQIARNRLQASSFIK